MAKFKFGKFETEIDATDVDFLKRYDAAAEKMQKSVAATDEKAESMEAWRYMDELCSTLFTFFDEVLGEGASSKLFGENRSVDMCADAVVKLKECATNYDGVVNKFNAISGNRAQRRAKK